MIGVFLIGTILISLLLFFNKNTVINYVLIICYTIMLWVLGFYEYNHLNTVELQFFKPDALGILLLFQCA
jgi:hydrogenase-4 component F